MSYFSNFVLNYNRQEFAQKFHNDSWTRHEISKCVTSVNWPNKRVWFEHQNWLQYYSAPQKFCSKIPTSRTSCNFYWVWNSKIFLLILKMSMVIFWRCLVKFCHWKPRRSFYSVLPKCLKLPCFIKYYIEIFAHSGRYGDLYWYDSDNDEKSLITIFYHILW